MKLQLIASVAFLLVSVVPAIAAEPKNLRGVIMALTAGSEELDSEGFDMSTYEDRFEQQQQLEQYSGTTANHKKSRAGSTARDGTSDTSRPQSTEDWCKQHADDETRCPERDFCIKNNLCSKKEQQQLEQNDGTTTTKSLHKKSGAGSTDSVRREGTRDSKPQSTENWCKQYADEPRCQTNNYCTSNNLCTNSTRVEPSSTRSQHLHPWEPSGATRVEPSSTREGPSDGRAGSARGCTTVECWCKRVTLEKCRERDDCVKRGFCADEDDSNPTRKGSSTSTNNGTEQLHHKINKPYQYSNTA